MNAPPSAPPPRTLPVESWRAARAARVDPPGRAQRAAAALPLGELGTLAVLVPVCWFPWRWPLLTLLGLSVIPLAWLLGWRLRGRLTARTGLEAPLAYVLLATCLATVPVGDWQLGLPKLLGMALGAATLVAVGNAVTSRQAVARAATALAGLALVLAGVGLVGVEWLVGKLPALDPLYGHLPALVRGVVPNTDTGGIHPNELAGVLVLVLPPLLAQGALGLTPALSRRTSSSGARSLFALLAGLAALGVLVATQSRSGLAGAAIALALLGGAAAVQVLSGRAPRSVRVAVPAVCVGLVGVGAWAGGQMLLRWVYSAHGAGVLDTFETRVELWERAAYMLQDFPFTGIGLGQFNPVLHALYVPFLVPPGQFVPHAHDLYLEYALELGIPGAVAFALVLLAFFRQCARAVRSADPLLRWTGLGLALGVVGFLAYGLTDAIAPGARAGLVLWIVLGLGAAVGNVAHAPARRPVVGDGCRNPL